MRWKPIRCLPAATAFAVVVSLAFGVAHAAPASAGVGFEAAEVLEILDGHDYVRVLLLEVTGDGALDLVSTHLPDTIQIRPGDGSGAFGEPIFINLPMGDEPRRLAVADWTANGHPDLAVVSPAQERLHLFEGLGGGAFTLAGTTTIDPYGFEAVAVDFDRDGHLDIALTHSVEERVNVYSGDGSGLFSAPTRFMVEFTDFRRIEIADLDEDGNPDLVVLSHGGGYSDSYLYVLFGNGEGGAASSLVMDVGASPDSLAVADFNEDAHLDLAIGHRGGPALHIYEGDGEGGLAHGTTLDFGSTSIDLRAADLDHDGHVDLVSSTWDSNAARSTLRAASGHGDGNFTLSPHIELPQYSAILTGDVNRDGFLDCIAVGVPNTPFLWLCLGDGTGGFQFTPSVQVGGDPVDVAIGDLNEDGIADAAVADESEEAVTGVKLLLGNGMGGFSEIAGLPVTRANSVAIADFDEDGHLDLLATSRVALAGTRLFFGNGNGGFVEGTPLPTDGRSSLVDDVDGDGHVDVVIGVLWSAIVYRGAGDGTFVQTDTLDTGTGVPRMSVGDFNGDGIRDLGIANEANIARFTVFPGDGSGSFGPPAAPVDVAPYPRSVAAADVDGDGYDDALLCHYKTGRGITILPGAEGTGIAEPRRLLEERAGKSLTLADFNRDSHFDIAFSGETADDLSILFGDGSGAFSSPRTWLVGRGPSAAAAADLDSDGYGDLLAANEDDGSVSVLIAGERSDLACRTGNLNARAGSVANVVFVNDSPGEDLERRVVVGIDDAFELRIDPPPAASGASTPFVLYLWIGQPDANTVERLPADLGTMCMSTPLRGTRPLKVANNLGHTPLLGQERWPGPPTMPAPSVLASGMIGREIVAFVQGLMLDTAAPGGIAGITNGIVIEAREP